MNSFLAFLADKPSWVVYALVGAILGGVGGAIGVAIERATGLKVARLLPVVAVALTPFLTRELVAPAIITAAVNQGLPRQLDAYTTLESASYSSKEFTYHYTLSDQTPETIDVENIKRGELSGMCGNFKAQFSSGDLVRVIYEYTLRGNILRFTLTPSDCV